MKYISLFSGIGGFEVAIHQVFPEAECLGYSEIKPAAIKVYEKRFPGNYNLGDVREISNETITELIKNGCDLIVGGFPCTNLTSLARCRGIDQGLEGTKSGLFYDFLRILKLLPESVNIIIENNASMSNANKKLITELLQNTLNKKFYVTKLDNAKLGVQTRKRLYWTTFDIDTSNCVCEQHWNDVLEDMNIVESLAVSSKALVYLNSGYGQQNANYTIATTRSKGLNTFSITNGKVVRSRWQKSLMSDTADESHYVPYTYPIGKSRPIVAPRTTTCALVDRRFGNKDEFIIRQFSCTELERLFGYEDGWTESVSTANRGDLLANTVSILSVRFLLDSL
jgi:DNA-cytosine methyltransferase